ncbi:paramyosin, long form-like [Daphnia pulex]|uniref:Paramyosin n=1 Tax=Daphnia pulex TaxID=6669 RepID=E9HSV9_DAPPU|nr:paramyosin, long form-like [Daphnia pulex]XP_046648425.1 paramyosin, long form-like [Daphnia pulicaria]XP_046648847.1 paramyosin, long form-like [Daphnia pulicaria]EFX65159.1 paramyosin [Daphnia pulex]|eukprot:EFX65159.1 paramyosin [Daphnia pulex]
MSGTVSKSSTTTKSSKYVYRSTGGAGTDVTIEYSTDMSALSRLEDKIRLVQEDLETERELRQRVERDKADLSVMVIQLQERLEEAEGGAGNQLEINKKRDAELAKLRKLLEDVHLESEETAHMLRKKHQEAVVDLQDQLELLAKAKSKAEKEKSKFQQELFELMSQVESANKDRATYVKQVEKLELHVHEYTLKVEELNRTIIDISSHKTRLSTENIELTKEVQELKVSYENISYLKNQISSQFEDLRRRFEDEERRRSTLEGSLHSVEIELESVRVQLEEEAEARLDLERQLSKANQDCLSWKSKYDHACTSHTEEIEEIRRKFHIRVTELEEQISALISKCSGLEKIKSRLQSEVEVLIIDLEKANTTAREMQKRSEQLERINIEFKSKLDELTALYDASQRDNRNKATEISRLTHELDKTREQKDQLTRENKKLGDENAELKSQYSELNRRFHELEIEYRRLENEREELAAAYKESEAARKGEEQRSQRMAAEMNQYRHDMERRLTDKEEELESIKKQMSIEIDQLNSRLVDAETKLKTEIQRIRKKMMITITELEMTLDVANKNNIDLQKTIKKQSLQLTELQSMYEETQRQLQITMDQYGVAQRRLQAMQQELEEMRANMEAALRARRAAEQMAEDASARINELTTVNVNLTSIRVKLEQELSVYAADFEEASKELKLADDRAQRAQVELKHTMDVLHEEQERIVKIESIKKALEVEIKNLTIRLEEVETNALVSSKRIISKLEARVRDIELELDEERRRHAETTKILRKKERQVKEIIIQGEEDHKNVSLLQDSVEKLTQKLNVYKRQLQEQEGMSQQNLSRVRKFQRELEAAEDRAESAETNLNFVRAKHRTFVTSVPGGSTTSNVYVVEEQKHFTEHF